SGVAFSPRYRRASPLRPWVSTYLLRVFRFGLLKTIRRLTESRLKNPAEKLRGFSQVAEPGIRLHAVFRQHEYAKFPAAEGFRAACEIYERWTAFRDHHPAEPVARQKCLSFARAHLAVEKTLGLGPLSAVGHAQVLVRSEAVHGRRDEQHSKRLGRERKVILAGAGSLLAHHGDLIRARH